MELGQKIGVTPGGRTIASENRNSEVKPARKGEIRHVKKDYLKNFGTGRNEDKQKKI